MMGLDVGDGDSADVSSVLNNDVRESQFLFIEKPADFWSWGSEKDTIENSLSTFRSSDVREDFQKLGGVAPRILGIFVLRDFVSQLVNLLKKQINKFKSYLSSTTFVNGDL